MSKIPVFQFKVTLEGFKPPIWRRFIVPSDYTFQEFAELIMVVMGWSGLHLSDFYISRSEGVKVFFPHGEDPYDDDFWENEYSCNLDAREAKLTKFLPRVKRFFFTYDMIDSWSHVILLEKVLEDEEFESPVVLKYKGLCPEEAFDDIFDCHGEAIAGNKLVIKRAAKNFDPEYNLDDVNNYLRQIFNSHSRTIYGEGELF